MFAFLSSLLSHLHGHVGADVLVRDFNTVFFCVYDELQQLKGDKRGHLAVKIEDI